jgi:hypothetical protein
MTLPWLVSRLVLMCWVLLRRRVIVRHLVLRFISVVGTTSTEVSPVLSLALIEARSIPWVCRSFRMCGGGHT